MAAVSEDSKSVNATEPGVEVSVRSPESASPPILVLVHGTKLPNPFKKGVPIVSWTDETSQFREAITAATAGYNVDSSFKWSGSNSHAARILAGDELAVYLCRLHKQHPDSRIVILAHSHGGTVTLYALARSGVSSFVSDLICMNTPFIECRKRDLKKPEQIIPFAIMGLFIFFLIVTLNSAHFDVEMPIATASVFAAFAVFFITKRRLAAYQEYFYELIRQRPSAIRMVNVTCDDEVSFWLGLAHFLGQLPFRIWYFFGRWGFRLFLLSFGASILCGLIAFAIVMAHGNSLDTKTFAGAIASLFLIGFGYLGAGIPIFAGLTGAFAIGFLVILVSLPRAIHGNRFAFGDDLVENLVLDITANKEPAIANQQNYSTFFYRGAALGHRHFAYQFPTAIEHISKTLTSLPAWEAGQGAVGAPPELPSPPPSFSWRSTWEDFRSAAKPKTAPRKPASRFQRVLGGVFSVFVVALMIFGFASEFHGCAASNQAEKTMRAAGLPSNVSFGSDTPLPAGTLAGIAREISGYQNYLESVGHPHSWRSVRLTAEPKIESDSPDGQQPHLSYTPSDRNPLLELNASSLPQTPELTEAFGELLLDPGNALVDDGLDHTNFALSRAANLYFCANYVRASCDLYTASTWPNGTMDLGGALAASGALFQTLISIRQTEDPVLADKAVMHALMVSQGDQHADVRRFVSVLVYDLGGNTTSHVAILRQHGIPLN